MLPGLGPAQPAREQKAVTANAAARTRRLIVKSSHERRRQCDAGHSTERLPPAASAQRVTGQGVANRVGSRLLVDDHCSRMHRNTTFPGRHEQLRGFSLFELLLVTALASILLGFAVPAYRDYVARAYVSAAVQDIGKIEMAIARFRLNNNELLPATLAAVGHAATLDPWGRPYVYLNFTGLNGNGGMRKNRNLVPINSDYDLYSLGEDGASASPLTARASRDDIVRGNDGGFIGLAEDY
jgi:general secretion pathway protein G